MKVIFEQNGGHNYFEVSDEIIGLEKRRSYILAEIDSKAYDIFYGNKELLYLGTQGIDRSGGILLEVFKPGENLAFDYELLNMEDHEFPKRTIGYSTFYTSDIIENYKNTEKYRIMAIDMIWCRENVLSERLNRLLNNG